MTSIVTEPTAAAQWQTLVSEAEQAAHRNLGENLESYLVFTLMRFNQQPEMVNSIMALEFLQASQQGRPDNFRDVGDKCLLFSGLFPQTAKRRLVRISYFVNLGRSAYQHLHESLGNAASALYGQLASDFVPMMDVLLAMRELDGATQALEPIEAFDLWQDTQSQHAKNTLHAATNQENLPPNTTILSSGDSVH